MKNIVFTIALALSSLCGLAQIPDEEAVKEVCQKSTEAVDQRNLDGVFNSLANVSYAAHYSAKSVLDGSSAIQEAYRKYVSDSPQVTVKSRQQSNWTLKALGHTHYWVTYDQVTTGLSGWVVKSKEVRLLEKIDGKWKIVATLYFTQS